MADKKTTLVAVDVINGDYGNGTKRYAALRRAGYNPDVIQAEVNRLMTESKKKSIDTLAHEVIDGYWRSGAKREKVLKACGCNYDAIQKRVNEILNPPVKKSIDELAFEVVIGDWGSGAEREKRLKAAGYDYNAVQNRVNNLLAQGFRMRRQVMQPWYDACEDQEEWSYNARYNWKKWDKTIKGSKDYGTCITYPSVVAMRTGMIKEGRYITSSGSDDDSQATLDEFWAYSMKSLASVNSKYWRSVKYPNKTTAQLVKEGKIKEGDIIGFMGHTSMYAGRDKNGNLLFNNAGHAAGIDGDKPGSNRAVLNQKSSYMTNRKVYGVFSVNTFCVMTKCEGGIITRCDQYMAGQNVTITIKPSKGSVQSLKVDGKVVSAASSYTFKKIDANHTIEAVCGGDDPEKKGYTGKFPDLHLVKSNAQVIADTIEFARWIMNDNDFHYGHGQAAHKCGCYFCKTQPKSKRDAGIKMWEHSQCCNPFVNSCFAHGGCVLNWLKVDLAGGSYDWNSMPGLKDFKRVSGTPKAGDIVCCYGHMALSLGGNKVIEASGGDDNVIRSKSWNNSIREDTWNGYTDVYRYVGSVDVTMPLRHGEVSDRVADMQRFLIWYGTLAKGEDDREFGDKTFTALKDFQRKEGLEVDGVCGIDSINKMKTIVR